jgi:hypothetical protein
LLNCPAHVALLVRVGVATILASDVDLETGQQRMLPDLMLPV